MTYLTIEKHAGHFTFAKVYDNKPRIGPIRERFGEITAVVELSEEESEWSLAALSAAFAAGHEFGKVSPGWEAKKRREAVIRWALFVEKEANPRFVERMKNFSGLQLDWAADIRANWKHIERLCHERSGAS